MAYSINRYYGKPVNRENGFYDKEADCAKSLILNSQSVIFSNYGRSFYISENGSDDNDGLSADTPWKTAASIMKNYDNFCYGDTILFQRGGLYRLKERIKVKSGMNFGAYGEGEKPKIYGSIKDFSDEELWEKSSVSDIWQLKFDHGDIGNIILKNEQYVGVKKFAVEELTDNGDFYHDLLTGVLYFKCDLGNPAVIYKNIEIAHFGNMFMVLDGAKDIWFDNLCLKYGGSHGIGTCGHNKNIRVTNCEIGFIGGSLQNPEKLPKLRYGNAIQFWTSAEDCIIENNWVYDIYDAGLTFQGGYEIANYKNLSFCNNLVEYCTYSFEFFDRESESKIDDVRVCNNIMRFAGYGWGNQRPDKWGTSHINGWTHFYKNMRSMYICNNVFDCSDYNVVFWFWNREEEHENLIFSNNSYSNKKNSTGFALKYHLDEQVMASTQEEFKNSIGKMDHKIKSIVFK